MTAVSICSICELTLSILAIDRVLVTGANGQLAAFIVQAFADWDVVAHTRQSLDVTDSAAVARAIRHGKGVIVIHGVDYNGNGKYDFASAGKSDLDPSLPAEATDPALCGVLR